MDRLAQRLIEQALELPPEDRRRLLFALSISLEADTSDPTALAAAVDEAKKRLATYDRGEVAAIDMDEALRNVRARLRRAGAA